ncbi:MAG: glycosyltransferase [Defluviitaleaceae bacterium]|nr:glycosyltransferase [Defluviitaleaceae bacterium]
MQRILIILPNLDLGGTETVVMNYFRNISGIVFDFVVHGKDGYYEEEARALGARIFRVPTRSEGFVKNIRAMRRLYKKHPEYDKVIVCTEHALAFIEMAVAWACGVKTRVAWSHFSDYQGASRVKRWAHYLARPFLRLFANLYFACTADAGRWLFGKKYVDKYLSHTWPDFTLTRCVDLHKKQFHIINNAIDLGKFSFSKEIRNKIRDKFNIGEQFAIGMVARLTAVKNHDFALDVINELSEGVFLVIGDGKLKSQLVEKVERLNLTERVIFTGAVDNPGDYYQALDLLLIPSLHEGLTLVAIEAQAAGLPVLLSDTITDEIKISNYAHFLSLEEGAEYWAKTAASLKKSERASPDLSSSGFHISHEVEKFREVLLR